MKGKMTKDLSDLYNAHNKDGSPISHVNTQEFILEV